MDQRQIRTCFLFLVTGLSFCLIRPGYHLPAVLHQSRRAVVVLVVRGRSGKDLFDLSGRHTHADVPIQFRGHSFYFRIHAVTIIRSATTHAPSSADTVIRRASGAGIRLIQSSYGTT